MPKRHLWFALVALLAVMALSLLGIVSTSPSAGAATSIRLDQGPYYFEWAADATCGFGHCNSSHRWNVDTTVGVFYNGSSPGHPVIDEYEIGGNGNGYQEIKEYAEGNGLNGQCMAWNNTLAEIVQQTCTGASWQLWAGTGGTPDLIWNQWYNNVFHDNCSVPGGYTQSVVSADLTGYPAGDLQLYCPETNATTYSGHQKWYVNTGQP